MKKIMGLLMAVIMVFAAAGCSAQGAKAKDYMSLKTNTMYTYESDRADVPSWQIYADYIRGEVVQRRAIYPSGYVVGEVYQAINDNLQLKYGKSDFSEHVDITGLQANQFAVLLKSPIKNGAEWVSSVSSDGLQSKCKITSIKTKVTTPAGTFNTFEVTETYPATEDYTVAPWNKSYFAKGVGIVKTISSSGISTKWRQEDQFEDIITTQLVSIEENVKLTENETVYYPTDDGRKKAEVEVTYETNNDLVALYNTAGKKAVSDLFGYTLGENTKINSAAVDYANTSLLLDFSAGLLDEMKNAPSKEKEEQIYQAIVDTFGGIFNCSAVCITVDGQPYASANITKASGEYSPVTLTQSANVFYPTGSGRETMQVEISFLPNEDMISVFNRAGKKAVSELLGYSLSENTKINNITVDEQGRSLLIDFSAGLLDEMKKAPSGQREEEVFQAIVDTFGGMYNSLEVCVTIDGKPYVSDHMTKAEGEYTPVTRTTEAVE